MNPSLILAILLSILSDSRLISLFESEADDHAFYVSVIRLKQEANASSGTIEFTIFSDDLLSGLRNHVDSSGCKISDVCACSSQIQAYITSKTKLIINDSLLELQAASCEQIGETHKVIYPLETNDDWNTIQLECTLLMELFPTQNNMVYVSAGDSKATTRLTAKQPGATIDLR